MWHMWHITFVVLYTVCCLVQKKIQKNNENVFVIFILWFSGIPVYVFFLCCCLFWIVVLYYMYGITHVVLCKKKSKIQKNNANVFHRFYFHIVIFWNAMPVYVKKTYRKDACFAIINASASMSAYVIHKKNKISSATANVFRFIHLLYYYFYM